MSDLAKLIEEYGEVRNETRRAALEAAFAEVERERDEALDAAASLQTEVSLLCRRDKAVAHVLDGLDAEIERTVQHRTRNKGGQTVPDHSDFASVGPSGLSRLRWWSRAIREALRNTKPPSE